MRIAIGADHGGYERKEMLKAYFEEKGHSVLDVGTDSAESVGYPVYGKAAAKKVAEGSCERDGGEERDRPEGLSQLDVGSDGGHMDRLLSACVSFRSPP